MNSNDPFDRAFRALRELSLLLQFMHRKTKKGAYKCPIRPNPQLEKDLSTAVLDPIVELTQEIGRIRFEASGLALKRLGPSVRRAARKERKRKSHEYPPGVFGGLSTQIPKSNVLWKAQAILGKKIATENGVQNLVKQRSVLIDTIFQRHAETLVAIDRDLPEAGGAPITRKEARLEDEHLEDYLDLYLVPVDKLQERVRQLVADIRSARERAQNRNSPPAIATGSVQLRVRLKQGIVEVHDADKDTQIVQLGARSRALLEYLVMVPSEVGVLAPTHRLKSGEDTFTAKQARRALAEDFASSRLDRKLSDRLVRLSRRLGRLGYYHVSERPKPGGEVGTMTGRKNLEADAVRSKGQRRRSKPIEDEDNPEHR